LSGNRILAVASVSSCNIAIKSTSDDGQIAPSPLFASQHQEMDRGVPLGRENVAFLAAALADPSPLPDDGDFTEERRLDGGACRKVFRRAQSCRNGLHFHALLTF